MNNEVIQTQTKKTFRALGTMWTRQLVEWLTNLVKNTPEKFQINELDPLFAHIFKAEHQVVDKRETKLSK